MKGQEFHLALNRRLGRLLRASVAVNGPTPIEVLTAASPKGFAGLALAAESHGVTGYVHRATAGSSLVEGAEFSLLSEYRLRAVRNHLRTLGDLRLLHRVLGDAGVPWLVLKGPALASTLHGGPELRSYRDLDVLVPAGQFGAAASALVGGDCAIPRHDWTALRENLGGEIDVFMPSGTHLDLHWHLISEQPDRLPYAIDLAGLFDRQREFAIGSDRFATLSHLDTALHVALHAMLSGAQRLIAMKDLQLALRVPDIAIEQVLDHARRWRAEIPFRVALVRMERAVGWPPQVTVNDPTGTERTWARLASTIEKLSPLERIDDSFSLGRTFARLARGDASASMHYVTRRTREKLAPRSEARGDRLGSDGASRTATHREMEHFFETVAQQ